MGLSNKLLEIHELFCYGMSKVQGRNVNYLWKKCYLFLSPYLISFIIVCSGDYIFEQFHRLASLVCMYSLEYVCLETRFKYVIQVACYIENACSPTRSV